ncbi:hypothetical protein TGRH88_017870 [Toxoplasma gondii]|nr:hypothetical protein TGRH88_017870 [Toxoplasma gondii]
MHLSSPPRPAALASAVTPGDQRRDSASDGVSSSEKEAERREGKQATYSNERSSDRMLERFSELWGDSGGLQGYLPSDCGAEERQHGDADPEEDEEGDFSRYCRAFYREQERQQQRLLQGPVDELERLRRPLEEVLEGVSQMERDGARLQTSKEEVRRCTAGVHRACRHLLQEQSQLQHVIEMIQNRLAYYTRYEGLRQLLESPRLLLTPASSSSSSSASSNSSSGSSSSSTSPNSLAPSTSVVSSPVSTFSGSGGTLDVPGLSRALAFIDEAEQFFSVHPEYAEASSYLWKYELLGTRARAVVRSAVVQTLEACQANVEKRLRERREAAVARRSSSFAADAQRDSSSEKEAREREPEPAFDPALFHVSFRVAGAPLKPLTTLLVERQRQGNPEAYASAIDQLEAMFVGTRLRLMLPPLKEELHRVLLAHATLADATRHIARYGVSICEMELRTFYVFFPRRRQKEALRTLLEAIGNCAYDCMRPPALACDSVEQLSEIVESLLLDVLQPIDLDREKAEDLSPFLSAIYRLVRDIQERLLFRADAFIERHIRSYPAAPTELVAFIFSSLGFPSPARSLPLPDSSLSPASSVFFPVRAALHLATLLRQTVSAEAFGSLCGAALEASCAALSRACLSLEHAVHNGFSPKSCLPPATLEAVQNSATFSSSASPSSLTSSASPDTSPLSSAASASVNLPFHVFLRQLCEARCDAAAGEAGSRLRTARPHPREEDLSPDGEVFSALWAELICTLFLLKHLTVLHSFLDSFRDGDFSPVCRKICFPRMLFAGSRLASAGASGSAGNEGGCEVSPETREKKSEEEGGRKMRFALLSWLFRPEAQEETLDIREVLREETKRRLDGLLATLVAAFALPVEKRLAQLPVAGRLQHEDTANASFVHEQQLKETLEEFQRNLQDQLPAVLLLAILFFDMGEQEGTREQGEGEQEEGEQEEGGRKVHGEMARKWRQREEVLDSMEFLIQPLFSGILSAYK